VDPISRRQFWDLIRRLSDEGVTILVTTHYLDEAEHCHRLALLHAGRLAAIGTVAELRGAFADRPIFEVQSPAPVDVMRALDAAPEVEKTSVFGTAVHAVLRPRVADPTVVWARLEAEGIPIRSATEVQPSLEDVFLDVVERAERA
jgi:ABC-2 type transport system ATP-binding protein